MLALRLSKDLEKRLNTLAVKTGRTKSFYAREAIIKYLEDMEDYYIAVEAYEEHLKSGGKTYTLAEVREELELDS